MKTLRKVERPYFWTFRKKMFTMFFLSGCAIAFMMIAVSAFLATNFVKDALEDNINAQLELAAHAETEILNRSFQTLRVVTKSPYQLRSVLNQNQMYRRRSEEEIKHDLASRDARWIDGEPNSQEVAAYLESEAARELKTYTDRIPALVEVFITDRYGGLVAASGKTTDYNQSDEIWWQAAFAGGEGHPYLEDLEFDQSASRYAFAVALPLRDRYGQVAGIVKGVFDAEELTTPIKQLAMMRSVQAKIVDSSGRVLITGATQAPAIETIPTALLDRFTEHKTGVFQEGYRFLIGFHEIQLKSFGNRSWYLYFTTDLKHYLLPLHRLARIMLFFSMVGIIVIGIIAAYYSEYILKPIYQLGVAMGFVTKRRFSEGKIPKAMIPQDDVGEVLQTYNEMVNTLARTTVSRDFFEHILNGIADPIFVKDRGHLWIFLNDAACRLFGHPREELIGKSDYDFFSKDEADIFWEKDELVFKTGKENLNVESITNHDSGIQRIIHTLKAIGHDDRGQEILIGTIRDMTAYHKAEEAKKQSEDRFRQLAENIHEVFWITSVDGADLIYISPAYAEIWGRSCMSAFEHPEEWRNAIHPEDQRHAAHYFSETPITGKYDVEYRIVRPDGSIRWVHDRGFPIRNEAGEIYRIAGIAEDITARKQSEAERAEMRNALENAVEGISLLSENHCFVSINKTFGTMVGHEAEDLIGKPWTTLLDPAEIRKVTTAVKGLEEKEKVELETHMVRKDGSVFHALLVLVPTRDPSTGNQGHYFFLKDITGRKFREALEIKYEFVSMVSHEVRTPLHSVKEGVNVLLAEMFGSVNDSQKEILNIAKRNIDRLARLINNVLDYQKLEAGAMRFSFEKTDVNELIHEVRRTAAPLFKNKEADLVLNLQIEDSIPQVRLDRDKIFHVLLNLLHNAIKFTDEGSITIEAHTQNGRELHVSVEDTGIGLSEEEQAKLFRSFGQLESGRDRSKGGTGLGLVISKMIVENHRGRLSVSSTQGKGSTFSFTIPLQMLAVTPQE